MIALAFALVAVSLMLAACGGSDDEEATTTPAPAQPPSAGSTPPSDPGALPPEFTKCTAARGYKVESSADIHSAPQQVLQACFGSLHGSGGAP